MEGEVKFFHENKGWGFIVGIDGNDYFAHAKEVVNNEVLSKGVTVSFDPVPGDKGSKAKNICLLV